ncbi:hypothetical protein NLX83_26480 [Allokutzneria sp. A3M-2-11 16]|uniref:hypothetical protein n=1 Tax=Allokutzneria sp. A3M-2-11 16 TaxID=2962043 RepID=UPI0020B8BC4D|nr:hypothetical protein [Allokutzneria sp. A3M-2-11 16]MCP3802826.1 hypothetical protein [Allokutzneria sp. A3M-2-11 16]
MPLWWCSDACRRASRRGPAAEPGQRAELGRDRRRRERLERFHAIFDRITPLSPLSYVDARLLMAELSGDKLWFLHPKAAYRSASRQWHPDIGGDAKVFRLLQAVNETVERGPH